MSKIKLVPVPNITKRELMTALMDGRKFTINMNGDSGHVIHWDDKFGDNPVRMGVKNWNFRGLCYLHEITQQQWYEDPDMVGKPVKVRDDEDEEWCVTVFTKFESSPYPFKCAFHFYKYAEPVTAADLYQEQV